MPEEGNDAAVVNDAPVVEETTTQDSSPVEETVIESSEEIATPDEPVESEETNTTVEPVEAAPEEVDMPEGLTEKSQNRFQKLANRNRELEEKIAQLEQLQVPTEEDYLEGGYDPIEAKVNAMQAERQQEKAIAQVERLNSAYDTDMLRIMNEYPQLNPKSDQFSEELAMELFTQYDQDSGVQYTEDNIVLGANQLPYQYIKDKMNLIGKATAKAQVKAQKDVERMVAAADTQGSKAPSVPAGTETLEQMRERLSEVKF